MGKLTNIRELHKAIFTKFGIDTNNKPYELCVEILIQLYLDANKELKKTERERYAQEIRRLVITRTN